MAAGSGPRGGARFRRTGGCRSLAAGSAALTALLLAAWNLSSPLATPGGAPLTGLRYAVGFLVATAAFGVVYAFDRHTGWFPLMPHRVLAHAHLGLIGALGLTYMAVAEKLWPMFLLAHPPGRSPGELAVRLVPAGVVMLVPGLLVPVPGLAVAGAVVVAGGLGAAAGLAPVSTLWRSRLVSAEVVALAAWLGLAVVGHAHKIVPFIAYTALRARGVSHHPTGGPLLFSHLFDARLARVALVGAAGGFGALLVGVLVASPPAIAAGGLTLAVTGVLSTVNLVVGPVAVVRAAARPSPQTPRLEGGTCR